MKSIFVKYFLYLSLILSSIIMATGALILLPPSNSNAEERVESLTDDSLTNTASAKSILENIEVDKMALTIQNSVYGHSNVFVVSTAEDLAYIAYQVAANNTSYRQGVYVLQNDIDLSGALWTPIGTYDYPFQGIFYGQGHVISNINLNDASIDANSNSAVGLFGNIDSASIMDIILRGSVVYNTSRTKGALVGNMLNSEIINCYDETSKVGYNGASFTNSVGAAENSNVFRGNSYNGTSIDFNNVSEVNKTIICPGVYNQFVAFYKSGDGIFYKGNNEWYEPELVRVLVYSPDMIFVPWTGNIKNNLYQTKIPVLRENATENDIYWLKEGYKASIPNEPSISWMQTVTGAETSINVNYNYGYGEGRTGFYTMKYDQTFASYFASAPYMNVRSGYEYEGLYGSASLTASNKKETSGLVGDADYDYKNSYPTANSTYYFSWTANTDNNLYFQFLIASDEGGKFTTKEALKKVIKFGKGLNAFTISGGNLSIFDGDNLKLTTDGITSGEEVSLSFELEYGYRIKVTKDSIFYSENEVEYDSQLKAESLRSGICANFIGLTGTGSDYKVGVDINNDSYNKVVAFISSTLNESTNTFSNTISIDNIAGNNGCVYIIVERVVHKIDLTAEIIKEASEPDIAYQWKLINGENLVDSINGIASVEGVNLHVKHLEEPLLQITTALNPDSSGVVIEIASYDGMHDKPTIVEKLDDSKLGYYRTWQIRSGGARSDGYLAVRLGYLKSRVAISSVDTEGNVLDIENTYCEGLSTVINDGSAYLNNSGFFVIMNTQDKIITTNNGYYYATQIEVSNANQTQTTTYDLTDNSTQSSWQDGRCFVDIYNGTGVNHHIKVTFAKRHYDVNYEYYFAEQKQTAVSNLFGVTSKIENAEVSSLLSLNPESIINIEISLKPLGKGILYIPTLSVEITQEVKEGVVGYKTSSITKLASENGVFGYDLNLGTYNTTVKFYFEFREVEFSINKIQVLNGDSSVELATGIKAICPVLTFSYDFSAQTPKLTGDIGNISIHSQYYLLGWYLKNGQVVESENYSNLLTNGSIVADVAGVGETSSSSNSSRFSYNGVNVLVQQRTVNVKKATGNAGYGQFYLNNQTTVVNQGYIVDVGVVVYAQTIAITNDTFYNLGYTFNSWSVPANSGSIDNGNYSIKEGNWYNIFSTQDAKIDENGYQTWNSFSSGEGESRIVILSATWEIIEYTVRVDDSVSTVVKIGDSVSYETTPSNRDGQAIYTIGENTVNGSVKNGYVVTGYTIKQSESVTRSETFALNPTNFLSFISSDYRFQTNTEDSVITLTTERREAIYKIYFDNSDEGYYTYGVNSAKITEYGGIENDTIFVYVTFNSKPENIKNALDSKALTISRNGYKALGWAISNDGVQGRNFDVDAVYTSIVDLHVVPTWTLDSQTVKSNIDFGEDVGEIRTFYLTNSHDVALGWASGDNITGEYTVNQTVFTNGEKITSVGFNVTFDGKTFAHNSSTLNIDLFAKAGVVKVQYFVNVEDSLSKVSKINYQVLSDEITFTMAQNNIYFFGYDLHSVYNGTSEFVASTQEDGIENNFGSFIYRYDWNGYDRASEEEIENDRDTQEYFNNFSILGTDFNAGSGKNLKLSLNENKFEDLVYSDLFDNVLQDADGYYVVIENELTIEKAQITISFPNGSAYYFENVVTIVYENAAPYQFSVGSVTFTYNYDRILLVDNAQPGNYQGQKDHNADIQKFVIEGLSVEGYNETLLNSNFEWNVSEESSFNLLDSSTALKLQYLTRYLTAENGNLKASLSELYNARIDTLSISKIVVDNEIKDVSNLSQFSVNYGNDVIMSVAGNGSMQLYVYVNKAVLQSATLSFSVSINYVDEHKEVLYPLAFGTSENGESYSSAFDSENSGNDSIEVVPTAGGLDTKTYAVLTDVVKVSLNYNGGKRDDKANESVFVSVLTGEISLTNPVYSYSQIEFGGYTESESNLTVVTSASGTTFTAIKGGRTQVLKAKWILNDIEAVSKGETTRYASKEGISLPLNDIATITTPEIFESKSYSLSGNGNVFLYNSTNFAFEVKNNDGFAVPSMSGVYSLTLSFVFNDNVQAPQTKTKTLVFTINIVINTIDVNYNGNALVFNNTNQAGQINIDFLLNGSQNGSMSIGETSTEDSIHATRGVYVVGSPSLTLKNAGDYTITYKIVNKLSEIYQFVGGGKEKALTISIEKYEIVLADYQDDINLSKVFGQTEPTLQASIIIADNGNDEVLLSFTRESGEGLGEYALTFSEIVNSEDKNNYSVKTDGFTDKFEIFAPNGNLKVELLSKFAYTYNGYAIGQFTSAFNGTNYTLSAVAGNETLSITYNLYYVNGSNKVEIPADQKEVYASVVEFSSNAEAGVGEYVLSVQLSGQGEGWKGVDIANTENSVIKVSKRTITITSIHKVFDQTLSFVYNNVDLTSNTAMLNIENIVSYPDGSVDEIEVEGTLSSAIVGQVSITAVSITNEAINNYVVEVATSLNGKIIADKESEIVTEPANSTEFAYGAVYSGISKNELSALIPVLFNGGEVDGQFISISDAKVLNPSYSTGGYLKVGGYNVEFTLSSTNFTFGEERSEEADYVYSTKAIIEIKIIKIDITIANSTLKIAKPYDGHENVLSKFVGQNVNTAGGYYTSSDILSGDVITIISGVYNDKTIGENKEITLTFADDDDSSNYRITTNVVGDITKITLVLNKNGDTIEFVDGEKEFSNTTAIKTEYTGNFEENLTVILSEDNFLARVGYTQIGWAYNGVSLAEMNQEQKDELLQNAVDAGNAGVTIDAIWQINSYVVTINGGLHAISSITEISLPYYSNIDEIEITANEGYTFEGFNASNENATISVVSGMSTREGVIKLEHLLGDIVVNIQTEEIEVKIIIDYNAPLNFNVATENTIWNNLRERVIKYSELVSSDLPILKVTTEDTFDFDYWTLNENVSEGSNIWTRINGQDLTEDNLTGFTFKANWTESELSITVVSSNNAIVSVKDEQGNVLTQTEGKYTVHYLDNISLEISHNDWFKWTDLSINGNYAGLTGDTSATNSKTGEFGITSVESHLTINITTSAIKVTFTTSYTLPVGTTISKASGEIVGEYTADSGKTTIDDSIEKYQPKAGTYRQSSWMCGETEIAFSANAAQTIEAIYGRIPTSDISLDFKAIFAGLVYTINFDKNADEAVFAGTDAGKDVVTRQYIYGSTITNLPVLDNNGKDYIWRSGASEIFSNGKTFVTSLANSDCVLTFTADWEFIPYKVYIQISGNSDKVSGVTADGLGFTDYVEVILGSNQSFLFEIAKGYEISKTETEIIRGSNDTTIAYSNNEIIVQNVRAETVVNVVIKAKDYQITIKETGYETFSNSIFNVSYDQDITSIFNGETFSRLGYTLKGFKSGNLSFASINEGVWTFEDEFVQGGIYIHDGDLSLDAVWEYDASDEFIKMTLARVSVYYNGQAQKIAETDNVVASGETFALNTVFKNGEKVKEVYYMLNGNKVKANDAFELMYKDVLGEREVEVYAISVIEDVLTGETHNIESDRGTVTILASDVYIKNASIYSYYTGSSAIELISGASYGDLYFYDGTSNAELEIAKVEILDNSGLYSVGEGYNVKYYFNSLAGFKEENYSGLTKEGGFYTLETSNMSEGYKVTAVIRKSNATVNISGMGYESGLLHKVEGASVTFPEYVKNAEPQIKSIITSSSEAKIYSLPADFTMDIVIKNSNGNDITDNFNFVISGSYTIRSSSYAYSVDVASKYLTDVALLDSNAFVRVEQVVYDGKAYEINDQLNLAINGELIFSIAENGTKDINILITKGKSVNIYFSVDSDMAVVGWSGDNSFANAQELLQTLSTEGSKTYNASFTTDAKVNVILSDYKAVLMNLGDKGGDQGYKYIKLGSTVTLTQPQDWTGFEFAGWEEGQSGLSITENQATLSASADITATSIKALWTLNKPSATTKTFAFEAKIDGSEQKILLSDVLVNGIENYNSVITYSYEFLLDGKSLSKEDNFSVKALISSSDKYTLIVTAKKEGYISQSEKFEFNIIVNGIVLDSVTFSETSFTYENKNYASLIEVSFAYSSDFSANLDKLSQEESPYLYFTPNCDVIKSAGIYNLTLVLSDDVFDKTQMDEDFEYDYSVTVRKAELKLTQDNIPQEKAEKLFGMADPVFTFSVTMFEGENQEQVEITLTRATGESKGDYLFTGITSSSENFDLSINEGVHFSIIESNYSLKVVIDSKIQAVYTAKSPQIITAFNQTLGQWIMTIGESSSTLSLSYYTGSEYIELSGNLYVIALENVSFSLSNAIQKGEYDASEMTYSGAGNFADFEIEGKIEILSRAITLINITKVFDRTDDIVSTKANLSGLIDGDDVTLSGKYNQKTVGSNIELSTLTLNGEKAENYHIANTDAKGSITPLAVSQSNLSIENDTFEYGQLGVHTPLSEILTLVGQITLNIDGITSDLTDGFVLVSGFIIDPNLISNSGNVKAGEIQVAISITSQNFTGLKDSYVLTINVTPKEIDLSSLTFAKDFDETDKLPADTETSLIAFVKEGDKVEIDLENSRFEDASISLNKKVFIVLKGEDSANYAVLDNITGKINAYSIKFEVDASQENEDLVTDGSFVEDGNSISLTNSSFLVGYPTEESSEDVLASLILPTRVGYKAVGWKYLNDDEYVLITSENILALLQEVSTYVERKVIIYPVWEIEYYEISILGEHIDGTTISGSQVKDSKVRYFSDVTISVSGEIGYKIKSFMLTQGNVASKDLSDTGSNKGDVVLTKVASNIILDVMTDEIKVEFVIDLNLPQFTSRTDKNELIKTFNYVELGTLYQSDLPYLTVTNGTYNLEGYIYDGANLIESMTLKQVVDQLHSNLETDIEVSLEASWVGENYLITFDPNGGELTGERTLEAVYGQTFDAFPVATIEGKSNVWKTPDGEIYTQTDILHSVGTKNAETGVWEITFTAEWTNNPYNLTIIFGDKISIEIDGEKVVSGKVYSLVYSVDSITINVSYEEGYGYNLIKDNFYGDISQEANNNQYIVKDLTKHSVLNFEKVLADNKLALDLTFVDNYIVKIDGEEVLSSEEIVAKTESVVEIIFNAVKGYEFSETQVAFTGKGNLAKTVSQDKKSLTIVWSLFTGDANVSIKALASENIITVKDASEHFLTLTFNGQSVSANGGTFVVKTGINVEVKATLKYGYTNGKITSSISSFVDNESVKNEFSNSDRYYHFTAVLKGINESFELSFSAEERIYTFQILVKEGMEEYGEITAQSPQSVKYGERLTLTEQELRYDYIFDGWECDGLIISEDKSASILLDESLREMLESVDHGDNIKIFATYIKRTLDVQFVSGNYGQFIVSQDGVQIASVKAGRSVVQEVLLGQDVVLLLVPDKGYEVAYIKLDGMAINLSDYGYTEEEKQVSIYEDLTNPIYKMEVAFKASTREITVQAGTRIKHEEYLGTDAGGYFYQTDSMGNRLGDEAYLENNGKLIIGADYKIASYTDVRLYFIVQAKSGFTFSVSCSSNSVVINESVKNGIKIYSFSGIKEDVLIKAIFIAKENTVNVQFALEGEKESVVAGIIAVDSSTNLVSASPNRGSSLSISVVTSASISLDVYSSLAYELLADENGYLMYEIVYEGESAFDLITSGILEEQERTYTGFTFKSTLDIENVNANATIYIYVKPQIYSVKFVVNEMENVVMPDAVRYGQEFDLSALSEEEIAKVFMPREGYTFVGYYTKPLGQGIQYINENKEVIRAWLEDGYEFNGLKYLPENGFDPDTNTFTLYAGWVYNRAIVTVEFTPEALIDIENGYSIDNVIANMNSITAWTNQYSRWYAEILIGSNVQFKALNITGYEFVNWTVYFEDEEGLTYPASFTISNIQLGTYVIKADYNPTYTLTAENTNNGKSNGGKTYLVQDGEELRGASFDKSKVVTLKAIPNEGYKFLYWLDLETDEKYYGQFGLDGEFTYTFSTLRETPLKLKAMFVGKTVVVNFNAVSAMEKHLIRSVMINGKNISISQQFTACMGDEFKVIVEKSQGYGFEFLGAPFSERIDEKTGYYIFTYTFGLKELTPFGSDSYLINISFNSTKEKIALRFNIRVEDAVDSNEIAKAGKLVFKGANAKKVDVVYGASYEIVYEDVARLIMVNGENYRVKRIYLKNPGANDVTSWLSEDTLVINQQFIDKYFANQIAIDVYFERLIWTMEEFLADGLTGKGSQSDPYLVTSEEEFALVAYYVNNGLMNNGIKYADAHYVLKANIDFSGKYWEPIGTEENPFNGTFDLGEYSIKGVTHYKSYSNPKTSYGGLFWHLGEEAVITQSNNSSALILSIVAGIVLVTLLVILIVFIMRKKRKQKLDEVARR